jgi:molecular chaperone DnaK (HSP70)
MFGDQAMINIRQNMNSTFLNLNRMLAMRCSSEFSKKEKQYMLTNIKLTEDHHYPENVAFNFDYNNMPLSLPSESILAAFFNKIKHDMIRGSKMEIKCLSIGVPDYFTCAEKEALMRALRIAEIDNYNIINESSASKQ